MPEIAPLPIATDPAGVVHGRVGDMTLCGRSAFGWSRAVTPAIEMGLVAWCEACAEAGHA